MWKHFLPAGHTPGWYNVLITFPCQCVRVRPHLSRACTSFRYYATIAMSTVEATGNRSRNVKLVLCCLDGERVVGNNDNSVLASLDR